MHKCGLLTKGSDNLIPYMTRIYDGKQNNNISAGFKSSFCRDCKPHFIGVWDTVASVGWVRRKQFSDNRLNGDVTYGYQALSIDERRYHFRVSQWDEDNIPEGQTIEQVWFSGSHADVGGQEADRRISDITLEWMLRHAKGRGLILSEDWQASLRPDPSGEIKRSDKHVWRVGAKDRTISEGAKIHRSVFQRRATASNRYKPSNLPESFVEVD